LFCGMRSEKVRLMSFCLPGSFPMSTPRISPSST
jgi:hypothetical protein